MSTETRIGDVPFYLTSNDRLEEWLEGRTFFYVCAYEVTRHWGGPEEGGWWYDAGTPLASVPVTDRVMAMRELERLQALYVPEYAERRSRYSVIGQEDLCVCISLESAAAYPTERPHYE